MLAAEKAAPEGATHELKDLEVFEISLVDHPANKKPFLVIKSVERTMPKGTELTSDENGNLRSTEKRGFSAGRKKKLKGSLASAAKTLANLANQIDDAEDEEAFMKRVSAVAGTLGGMGGKPKGDKDDAKKDGDDDGAPEGTPAIEDDALSALEDDLQGAIEDSTPAPSLRKEDAVRLDKMEARVDSLTKATHTLVGVAKTISGGARPASQAGSAGESPEVQKSAANIWKLDMNSPDPDPDEQFIS